MRSFDQAVSDKVPDNISTAQIIKTGKKTEDSSNNNSNSNNTLTKLRCLIDCRYYIALIGENGSVVRSVMEKTGCSISYHVGPYIYSVIRGTYLQ